MYRATSRIRTSVSPSLRHGEHGYLVRWWARDRIVKGQPQPGALESQWFRCPDEARVFKLCVGSGLTFDEAHQAVWELVQGPPC